MTALTALSGGCSAHPSVTGSQILSIDAYEMNRAGRLAIIDIRPIDERVRDGAPTVALSAVYLNDASADGEAFAQRISQLVQDDHARPIALLCRRGITSRAAQNTLAEVGFATVYSIADGFMGSEAGPGWRGWGLPVTFDPLAVGKSGQ
ncbi:MAG: hypothetical protein IT564_00380 [Rhodospirillales bacterium]|nr:hypothetical protein [Rhodospirillales bacterium]